VLENMSRGEVVKARFKPRLFAEGTAECSHVSDGSRLIFVFEANFGRNVTIAFFATAREDALWLHACACVQHARRNASTRSAHTYVSMYARLVGLGSEVKRRD